MLKKSSFRRIAMATLILLLILLVYFFPVKYTYKENISYITSPKIPIYLIDKNNYTARTSIAKNTENQDELIKLLINSLTIGSIESSYIPIDFKAIIPENTKLLNYTIENKILTLNFNKNFLNIAKENENKLLEVLVYTLIEFKNIEKITILIENNPLTKFKSGTTIPKYLDKTIGINKVANITSLKNTQATTVYYICKNKDLSYFVPITKINNTNNNKVEIIIKELQTTPLYETNLISYLATSSNLTNYELLDNSISLSFDNYLLANLNNKEILEEVKYSIALSLRDTYNINKVIFNIQDTKDIISI